MPTVEGTSIHPSEETGKFWCRGCDRIKPITGRKLCPSCVSVPPQCNECHEKHMATFHNQAMLDTSSAAYHAKEADGTLETDRAQVLHLINLFGGRAIWEVAEYLGRPDSDISSRFRDLEKQGLIEKSQTVTKRNPRTHKDAVLWIQTRQGLEMEAQEE